MYILYLCVGGLLLIILKFLNFLIATDRLQETLIYSLTDGCMFCPKHKKYNEDRKCNICNDRNKASDANDC